MDNGVEPATARAGDEQSGDTSDGSRPIARRRVLTTIGGSAAVVLAGCLGDDTDDDSADDTDEESTYQVVYLDDDDRTEVETPDDETLLGSALDAGVDIQYSCQVGRCGQCAAKHDGDTNDVAVHDGNQYLEDDQIAAGWVLPCVAYPRDDFELELTHPDDR